jgi:hypothetical protein
VEAAELKRSSGVKAVKLDQMSQVNDYGATDNRRLMTGGWEQIQTGAWRAKLWCICPQWSVISRQSSVIFSSTTGGLMPE